MSAPIVPAGRAASRTFSGDAPYRRVFLAAFRGLAWLLCLSSPVSAFEDARVAEPAARLEYEVKAAFLFNFARFVEWPDVRGVGDRTFTIGILGSDPFGEILDRAVAGKKFNGQTIAVRRLREPKDATACRILFIGTSEDRRFLEIMETLRGAPVLTVTEMTTGKRGAVIRFFIEDRGVRFEVDLDAAARSGLKISSRLLSVARVLRDPVAGGR